MISELIKYAALFAGLTEEEQNLIVRAMRLQHFAAGEKIYKEGDESTALYVLEQGGVRLAVGDMALATLGVGSTFGESGVFLDRPRAVSATATTDTDAWALSREALEQLVLSNPAIGLKLSRNFGSRLVQLEKYLINRHLRPNKAFRSLTEEELAELASRFELVELPAGKMLYGPNQRPQEFYILEEGAAIITEDNQEHLVESGGVVGLVAMLDDTLSDEYAVTKTPTLAWKLKREALDDIAATSPLFWQRFTIGAQESTLIADEDRAVQRLQSLPLFEGVDQETLHDVARKLSIIRVPAGAVIYKAGSKADRVHIIEEGDIELRWPRGSLELTEGDIFGEEAILSGEPHLETAFAKTESELWELTQNDLEALILSSPIVGLNLSRELSHKLHKLAEQEGDTRKTAPIPVPVPISESTEPPPTQVLEPVADTTARTTPVAAPRTAAQTGKTDSLAMWFGNLSRGAKLRLVIITFLLLWLLGALTYTAASAFQGADNSARSDEVPAIARANDEIVQPVAMALSRMDVTHTPLATATYTPVPTRTPLPTNTPTPSPTPTNTPTATPTATSTSTPVPTDTPTPTFTPTPKPRVKRVAVAAARVAATPTPSTQYSLVEVRRLSPCENRGKHNIYVKVIDANGNGVDNVWVLQAPAGNPGDIIEKKLTEKKDFWLMNQEDGRVTFDMYKGAQYTIFISNDGVTPASTDFAQPVHSNFTDEAACPDGGGGNTLYHNSFSIIFRKNW